MSLELSAGTRAKLEERLKAIESERQEVAELLRGDEPGRPPAIDGPTFRAEPTPPFEWLIRDYVSSGSVCFFVGDSAIGKTSALVQLSLQLAAGRDLLGKAIPRPAKVLYLLAEGARHHFKSRVMSVARTLNLEHALPNWHVQREGAFNFDLTGTDVPSAIAQVSPDLVICDTLGYFYKGDENDATEWKRKGIGPVRQMIAEFGCAFLFVHHPRKDGAPWRGSSAFFDDSDHFLRMMKAEVDDGSTRVIGIDKNKYGPAFGRNDVVFDQQFMVFRLKGTE